jgi:prevent-host-death family protein
VKAQDPNLKGNVAEAEIAAAAIRLGVPVLKPLVEHGRYDLAFDLGHRLLRVQCKWAPLRGGVVAVNLAGYRLVPGGHVRSSYSAEEIDAVGVWCERLRECYLVPADLIAGMRALHLRVDPPLNGQRAALHWAADYELPGAIAQLGERLRGTQEVAGSSPASSTPPSDAETIGAHEFRNRFGWYLERAAQGASFLITRRGRPHARLSPADTRVCSIEPPQRRSA